MRIVKGLLVAVLLLLFAFQSAVFAEEPGGDEADTSNEIYELPSGHFLQSGKIGDKITICFPPGTDLSNVKFARANGFIPEPQWTVQDNMLEITSPGTGDPGSYTFQLSGVSAAPKSWLTVGVGGDYLVATAQPGVDGKGKINVHVQTGPNDDTPVVGKEVSIGLFIGEVDGYPVYSRTLSTGITDANGDVQFDIDLEKNEGDYIIAFDTTQLNRAQSWQTYLAGKVRTTVIPSAFVFSSTPYSAPGGFSNEVAVSEFFPQVTGLTIEPDAATINQGETKQFTATLCYSNGVELDATQIVNWSIADSTIATIDNAGLVTGVEAGETTVSASYDTLMAIASLIVNSSVEVPVPVDLVVTPHTLTIREGESRQFNATLYYSDNTTKEVTNDVNWDVDDINIAGITDTGLVTGINEGQTVVNATLDELTGSANLIVVARRSGGSSGGSSSGGGSTSTDKKIKREEEKEEKEDVPTVENLLESQFIARWPGHVSAGSPAKIPEEKIFTMKAEVNKPKGEYSLRAYYWNERAGKWIALPSWCNGDGTVRVTNDGDYKGWVALFWVVQPIFIDVEENAWYETVVNRANGLALLEGYEDLANPNTMKRVMRPDRNISRAEYVSIITRVLGMVGTGEQKLYDILKPVADEQVQSVLSEHFADSANIPKWCQQAVAAATESGIVKGIDGKFEPNMPVSRMQAFVIASNALSKIPGYQQDAPKDYLFIKLKSAIKSDNNLVFYRID